MYIYKYTPHRRELNYSGVVVMIEVCLCLYDTSMSDGIDGMNTRKHMYVIILY